MEGIIIGDIQGQAWTEDRLISELRQRGYSIEKAALLDRAYIFRFPDRLETSIDRFARTLLLLGLPSTSQLVYRVRDLRVSAMALATLADLL
jgi:hypothetical protein